MKTLNFLPLLAAAALLAPGGLFAQTTRTWDGSTDNNLSTTDNWTPAGAIGNTTIATWDNLVAGNLNLTFNGSLGGTTGSGFAMTANQTGNLTINNSTAGSLDIRFADTGTYGIKIASGAGAFTLGAAGTANPFRLVLASGTTAKNIFFDNDSASTATLHENVSIVRGGTALPALLFTGTGIWDVKASLGNITTVGANEATVTVNLLADNTAYTGNVFANAGTLAFREAKNLGSGTAAIRIAQQANNAALQFIGSTDTTISRQIAIGNGATATDGGDATITANGTTGAITFDSSTFNDAGNATVARTLTLRGANTGANTISGTIVNNTGVGATVKLIKEDAGKWVLSGDNTFTGGVDINGGTLAIGHNNALGTGELKFNDAAARIQSSDATDRTIANAVNFAQSMKFGAAGTGNLLFTGAVNGGSAAKIFDVTGTTEFNNTISGNGDRSKNGTGTLVFSGDNSGQAFNLYVNEGTLAFNSANALGAGISAIRVGQTTANAVLKFTGASDATVGRQISIGNGATATHTGSSTIQNDSATGALTFDNAAFNAASAAIVNRSLTLRGSNTGNNLISGAIVDNTGAAVSVVKRDAGTWNLTGENTFTDGLQIWEGVLEFDGNSSLGAQTIQTRIGRTVTSGTLRHTGASDTIVTGLMQVGFGNGGTGNGTVESSGAGTLSFNNAAFNIAEGAAAVNRTLTLGGNNTGLNTISGAIVNNNDASAKIALTKTGAGKWVLGGTNTYTGATLVSQGTLIINGSTSTGNVTVDSGATLGGNGTIGGATIISGTHNPGNSPGLQTFSSSLTYNNGSAVNWELTLNGAGTRGTDFDGINALTTLNINDTSTINLVFNGAGSTVTWANTFWDTDQSWLFYDVTGVRTGTFTLGSVSVDSASQTLLGSRGAFSIGYSGSDVLVNYTAVPEPTTWGLLAFSLTTVMVLRRRRSV